MNAGRESRRIIFKTITNEAGMAFNGQVTLPASILKFFSFLSLISIAGVKDTVGCEPPFLVAFINGPQFFRLRLWLGSRRNKALNRLQAATDRQTEAESL